MWPTETELHKHDNTVNSTKEVAKFQGPRLIHNAL
jgi:hypothetical protein